MIILKLGHEIFAVNVEQDKIEYGKHNMPVKDKQIKNRFKGLIIRLNVFVYLFKIGLPSELMSKVILDLKISSPITTWAISNQF